MKKIIGYAVLLFLIVPVPTFAHESRSYEINGVKYELVVGSLNEPVIVDDKTGVSVEIIRDGKVFTGAQDTLQVEMAAGDTKKIVGLSPVYGHIGQYKSNFIATVPTELSYRVFGTLESIPVDLLFICNAGEGSEVKEDMGRVTIADKVFQTKKTGAFGCPQAKADFGFPEKAESSYDIVKSVADIQTQIATQANENTKKIRWHI